MLRNKGGLQRLRSRFFFLRSRYTFQTQIWYSPAVRQSDGAHVDLNPTTVPFLDREDTEGSGAVIMHYLLSSTRECAHIVQVE